MGALLNLLAFPVSIEVRSEILGTRVWINVEHHRAQLCFPGLGPESDRPFAELEAPQVKGAGFLLRVHEAQAQNERDRVRWGSPWMWKNDQVHVASISHAVLRVPVDKPLDKRLVARIGEQILKSFADWFELFQTWVEVLTGQDLDPRHPIRLTRTDAVGLTHAWVADEGSPRRYSYVNPRLTAVIGSEETALTREQLRLSVRAASSGTTLAPERLLIRDAWAALRRDNYRNAVIDAATAVEAVVTSQLDRRLRRVHPTLVVRELLRQTRPIKARISLARRLGTKLPDELYDSVMKPRNETLHENVPLTRDRAYTALKTATDVISTHVPLPLPSGGRLSRRGSDSGKSSPRT
jgi:hypothetical protein